MLKEKIPHLVAAVSIFQKAKSKILKNWMQFDAAREVLEHHEIEVDFFIKEYGGRVFDYFTAVIRGEMAIGDCPVIADLLAYLKGQSITADELFILCSHFRKAMIDFSYDSHVNNKAIFDEISYVFDLNFSGVLKRHTATLYQKDQEIERNVDLLNEYKKALDQSAIVSKTDLDGVIIYANDTLCDVSGYRREELLGNTHQLLRHDDMPEQFFSDLWETIKRGKVFKGTLKNRKKNGKYFYVDTTVVPIRNVHQNITEYMAIGYEVTSLIDARQNAVEAGLAKDYFLSNMSHEIRTPLNAILGFVALLQDEITSINQKKYLDIIYNSGENLLSIINDILDFSKLRSGEFTIERKPFNLHEKLSHTLELFVPSANAKSITIISFIDPHIPFELVADALRMKQIVSNFLSNAIKFSPYKGVIEVDASYRDGILTISVKDEGIGIKAENQKAIFDAFAQVKHGEESLTGGTGLGLSICKQLSEHMGGSVGVESDGKKGSRFYFTLPVEANDTMALHMFDPGPFAALNLGLLVKNATMKSRRMASLKRYWQIFDMSITTVDVLDANAYDLLFFNDNEIDDAEREAIIAQDVPSIAIMEQFDDRYDHVTNVTPLYFPVYCSKLYHTFLEALDPASHTVEALQQVNVQRQFKGHILVAEDNSANQELIKIILENFGLSYTVEADGLEALKRFQRQSFDMVLMDEQMPIMNGLEATEAILRFEREQNIPHTPIAAITANVIKGAKERGLAVGFDAFLGKPIVLKEIEQVFATFLEEVSNASKSPEHDEADFGDVSIGIDLEKVQQELMLETDQVLMLLTVFKKKMDQQLPELQAAIEAKDLVLIGRLAHSIKGSSANFRLEILQNIAIELEQAAYGEDDTFVYQETFEKLKKEYDQLRLKERY